MRECMCSGQKGHEKTIRTWENHKPYGLALYHHSVAFMSHSLCCDIAFSIGMFGKIFSIFTFCLIFRFFCFIFPVLRPLTKSYQEVVRSVFTSSTSSSGASRRQTMKDLQEEFSNLYNNIRLFEKGTKHFTGIINT